MTLEREVFMIWSEWDIGQNSSVFSSEELAEKHARKLYEESNLSEEETFESVFNKYIVINSYRFVEEDYIDEQWEEEILGKEEEFSDLESEEDTVFMVVAYSYDDDGKICASVTFGPWFYEDHAFEAQNYLVNESDLECDEVVVFEAPVLTGFDVTQLEIDMVKTPE
jgi:hypothetical protein